AAEYPGHRLADEALNWGAWAYCFIANKYPTDSSEYEENYAAAMAIYRRIAEEDPSSSLALNAFENVRVIGRKVEDPSARVPVLEENWAWLLSPRFLGQPADDNHAATSVTNASRTAAGERWPWRPISHSRL